MRALARRRLLERASRLERDAPKRPALFQQRVARRRGVLRAAERRRRRAAVAASLAATARRVPARSGRAAFQSRSCSFQWSTQTSAPPQPRRRLKRPRRRSRTPRGFEARRASPRACARSLKCRASRTSIRHMRSAIEVIDASTRARGSTRLFCSRRVPEPRDTRSICVLALPVARHDMSACVMSRNVSPRRVPVDDAREPRRRRGLGSAAARTCPSAARRAHLVSLARRRVGARLGQQRQRPASSALAS